MPDALKAIHARLTMARACGTYLGVVVDDEDDEPVPDVPLDDELPVPLVLPLMLPLVPLLDDAPLEGPLIEPDELLGVVDDELDDDGVLLLEVSVDDDEELEAGGVAGVVTVVLLLLLAGGVDGVTVVVFSSLRSHPAMTPRATASALTNKILDFMGTPFMFCVGTKTGGSGRPFRPVYSQVRCHAPAQGARMRRPAAHKQLRVTATNMQERRERVSRKIFPPCCKRCPRTLRAWKKNTGISIAPAAALTRERSVQTAEARMRPHARACSGRQRRGRARIREA